MGRLWTFLQDKRNQQVLGWLGGGLAVVVGALWTAFVYFDRLPPTNGPTAPTTEDSGGNVIQSGHGSTNIISTDDSRVSVSD